MAAPSIRAWPAPPARLRCKRGYSPPVARPPDATARIRPPWVSTWRRLTSRHDWSPAPPSAAGEKGSWSRVIRSNRSCFARSQTPPPNVAPACRSALPSPMMRSNVCGCGSRAWCPATAARRMPRRPRTPRWTPARMRRRARPARPVRPAVTRCAWTSRQTTPAVARARKPARPVPPASPGRVAAPPARPCATEAASTSSQAASTVAVVGRPARPEAPARAAPASARGARLSVTAAASTHRPARFTAAVAASLVEPVRPVPAVSASVRTA
jgi:hypothetical protein